MSRQVLNLASIQQEWRQSERFRALVITCAVIVVLIIHIQLNDMRVSKKQQAQRSLIEYEDLMRVAKEKGWPQRAQEAKQASSTLKSWLWTAQTEGEAEAKFRDWLTAQANMAAFDINRISIDVGVSPAGVDAIAINANLRGPYELKAWQAFLDALSSQTPKVIVDYEKVNKRNARRLQYQLGVTAWFFVGDTKVL